MRVLHVINGLDIGGAETLLAGLLDQWSDEHHVVVLEGEGVLSSRVSQRAASIQHIGASRSSFALAKMLAGVASALKRVRPDVVHSHLVQSDLVSLLAVVSRAPRVTSIHVSTLESSDPLRSRFIARVVGLLSFRFASAIATSERSLEYMRQLGYKCGRTVITNGTKRTLPVPYKEQAITFLSLARFNPVKGHDVLIEAFADHLRRYPGSRLICAGQGVTMQNPHFRALVGRFSLSEHALASMEFLGPSLDVRALHEQASALVISSRGNETFPMVGSEACMAGVPVITTDVGGAAAFAVDENAVVQPGSPRALVAAFDWFASLPASSRSAMAEKSHRMALDRFDISATARKYSEVYRRVIR